tara:strand:+ start:896 stop:1495 length:600 start_codon:yes stop_codon:yes gene_type:complete
MMPFEAYTSYLSLKNHFTKEKYDYHKYAGKTRATVRAFYNRKDRYFFEKLSRQKKDKEVVDFFVSNFVSCTDPQTLWIGDIIKNGESVYHDWQKRVQSLSYFFKEEVEKLIENRKFDELFEIKDNRHPIILKEYLKKSISLETLIVLNCIVSYKNDFDKKLKDPIWELISLKIDKYSPFLNIDIFKYRKILKKVVVEEK